MPSKFDLDTIGHMDHLVQGFETTDQIGMVLRVHLQVERTVEVFLKGVLTQEMLEVFNVPQSFAHKVMLATALGFPKELALASLSMNSLRNKFAHEAGRVLKAKDVQDLEDKYEAARIAIKPELYQMQGSAIRVKSLGGEKITYGTKGVEWDFKMVAGALSGLMLRYLVDLNAVPGEA